MMTYLFDQESISKAYDQELRAEGRMEGRMEGRAEGRVGALVNSVRSLMNKLGMSASQAMDTLDIPADQRKDLLAAM